MKVIGEERTRDRGPGPDLTQAVVRTQASASYDFLISLRAIYHTDTWERSRRWAAGARQKMGAELYEEGRFFFEGTDTALGIGLLRLIPTLGSDASPPEFLDLLRETSAEECVFLMLDTGETPSEAIDLYRAVLFGSGGSEPSAPSQWDRIERYAGAFAERVSALLRDPAGCKQRLIKFLASYLDRVFSDVVAAVKDAVGRAAASTREIIKMQPTQASIEALTGGYTLSSALRMKTIDLAPSVFAYPFMAQRVDERNGRALVVFGIKEDSITGYQENDPDELLGSMKALANAYRLRILRLLRDRPILSGEFMQILNLSQPTVHHHLAQLRSCGLIRQERTPEGMLFSFRPEAARSLVSVLAQHLQIDAPYEEDALNTGETGETIRR